MSQENKHSFTEGKDRRKITREEAIRLHDSEFWEDLSFRQRVEFQLFISKLCMPFDVFHEAVEKSLGRPVYTHEFALSDSIKKEFLGKKSAPSFEEIMNLIPEEKRIVVLVKQDKEK